MKQLKAFVHQYYATLVALCVSALTVLFLLAFLWTKTGGHVAPAFYIGAIFPTPSYVTAADPSIRPYMYGGWDGQFYLYQAFDPFMRHADEINRVFDAGAYRYQRNAIPIITWCLHLVLPFLSMPLVYVLVQLAIIIGSSIVVARFFVRHALSPWFLLPMQLNAGVMATLRHGLPDASADFLLYAACVFLIEKRFIPAVGVLSVLVLTREPYLVLVGGVLLLIASGKYYSQKLFSRKTIEGIALFSVPILLYGAWYAFVFYRLGASPTVQGGAMTTEPFVGFLQGLKQTILDGKPNIEIISMLYFFQLLFVALVLLFSGFRKQALVFPMLLYVGITSTISSIGWYTWPHHSKNFSYLIGLLPIILIVTKREYLQKYVLPLALTSAVIAGYIMVPSIGTGEALATQGFGQIDTQEPLFVARPWMRDESEKRLGYRVDGGFPEIVQVQDYRAELHITDADATAIRAYGKWHVPFSVTVTAKNTSTQPWSPFVNGTESIPVRLSIQWLNAAGETVRHDTAALNRYVYPGESTTAELQLQPLETPGDYTLHISLTQAPVSHFDAVSPEAFVNTPIHIR